MTATKQRIENKQDLAILHDTKKNGGIGLWGEGALPPFFSPATTPENTPPETVNPTPSDTAHALHMKALAQRRYGITRARLERAEKIARATLTLTPRQRLIAPLIIAIGQKLQLPPADAAALVGELTQETAPDDE